MVGDVHREGALDADAETDSAHGETCLARRRPGAHDGALEDLHPLPVALDDPHMDLDGVARAELGDVVTQAVAIDRFCGVHGGRPSVTPAECRTEHRSRARPGPAGAFSVNKNAIVFSSGGPRGIGQVAFEVCQLACASALHVHYVKIRLAVAFGVGKKNQVFAVG